MSPASSTVSTDDRMGEVFGKFLDHAKPALVHFHCIQRLTGSIVAATARGASPTSSRCMTAGGFGPPISVGR